MKKPASTSSLTVLLPVHNEQSALASNVHAVLDVLPELTGRFELMIVDDGSTDATCEVAYELAAAFPQVVVVRNAQAIGWAAAVGRAISSARGDFVIIHGSGPIDADDVVGLWRLRDGIAAAALAPATADRCRQPKTATSVEERLSRHVAHLGRDKKSAAGRSGARLGVHARAPRSNLLMIHRRQTSDVERSLAAMPHTPWTATPRRTRRHGPDKLRAPSFLKLVKQFALGE